MLFKLNQIFQRMIMLKLSIKWNSKKFLHYYLKKDQVYFTYVYHFVMIYLHLFYFQNFLEYTHSYAANRFELKFDEILSDGDCLSFFHLP
jgi:hypothetical protein